jgi:ABC-2 type transport system ATP-binding protein
VLFSSHQLDLVERLCDDLVVLARGRVVAAGPVEEVRRERTPLRYRVVVEPDAGFLREEEGLRVIDVDGARALVELAPTAAGDLVAAERSLVARLTSVGALREFRPVVPTLSEIFREVIR